MKGIGAMLNIVPGWIYAPFLASALLTTCYEKTQVGDLKTTLETEHKQHKADDAQAKIDQANAVVNALRTAKIDSDQLQKVKDDALQKANVQLRAKTVDADRSRTELASLRDQTARDRVRMSNATKQAVIDYAATASQLLDQCSREYQELADKADGHAIDAGMIDGWPVMPKKTR